MLTMANGKFALFTAVIVIAACSASPDAASNAQSVSTRNGVPRNSPLEPDIRNVPATTGRANLPIAPAPFAVTDIGKFDAPFAMAFLPGDQGLLVTEKAGALKLRQPDGKVVEINSMREREGPCRRKPTGERLARGNDVTRRDHGLQW